MTYICAGIADCPGKARTRLPGPATTGMALSGMCGSPGGRYSKRDNAG